ncbi:MAG: hypothetical protein ACPL0B_03970 [Anaerolineales bacterium]
MQSNPYFHNPSKLELIFQTLKTELGEDLCGTFLLSAEDNKLVYAILRPEQQEYPPFYTTIIKIANSISQKMHLGMVEDNLIVTDRYYLLTRMLGQNDYYWGLIVSKQTPLGSVRILIDRFSPQILNAIV